MAATEGLVKMVLFLVDRIKLFRLSQQVIQLTLTWRLKELKSLCQVMFHTFPPMIWILRATLFLQIFFNTLVWFSFLVPPILQAGPDWFCPSGIPSFSPFLAGFSLHFLHNSSNDLSNILHDCRVLMDHGHWSWFVFLSKFKYVKKWWFLAFSPKRL